MWQFVPYFFIKNTIKAKIASTCTPTHEYEVNIIEKSANNLTIFNLILLSLYE